MEEPITGYGCTKKAVVPEKIMKLSDLVQKERTDVPEQGFTPTLEKGLCIEPEY